MCCSISFRAASTLCGSPVTWRIDDNFSLSLHLPNFRNGLTIYLNPYQIHSLIYRRSHIKSRRNRIAIFLCYKKKYLKDRLPLATRGDDIGVGVLLDALDGGSLRPDHQSDHAQRYAHVLRHMPRSRNSAWNLIQLTTCIFSFQKKKTEKCTSFKFKSKHHIHIVDLCEKRKKKNCALQKQKGIQKLVRTKNSWHCKRIYEDECSQEQEYSFTMRCSEKWLCALYSKQTEHTSCIKGCIDNSDERLLLDVGRQGVVEAVHRLVLLLLVDLTGAERWRGGSGRHCRQWSQAGRWRLLLLKRQRPHLAESTFREMHSGFLKEKFRLFDDIVCSRRCKNVWDIFSSEQSKSNLNSSSTAMLQQHFPEKYDSYHHRSRHSGHSRSGSDSGRQSEERHVKQW